MVSDGLVGLKAGTYLRDIELESAFKRINDLKTAAATE